MSIKFHCEYCGNQISAKDESAGKWGTCPACHNKLYIPDLNADIDDLTLAPIDEEAEKKQKELMVETYRITQDIMHFKDEAKEEKGPAVGYVSMGYKELNEAVVTYLVRMASGDLEGAKVYEAHISQHGKDAIDIIDQISVSEIPEPELMNIPNVVLSRLIKDLRSKIR